uniref:Uncharacterized protein n=1 Tax=Mycena chlorophos TaxID=658473 RepID=A0ABQ0LL36_MYCCL|nr:predicted protein [Mycena chlorophos]
MRHPNAFAWEDSERGTLRHDFFPPIEIPTVPHKVCVEKSIPIPKGQFEDFVKIIKDKVKAGVYEPSNASYRSKFFGVVKKDGKSIRLVHLLEPLNAVTIAPREFQTSALLATENHRYELYPLSPFFPEYTVQSE